MAEIAVTVFVVILVLGALQIPALGDAIGRRLRKPLPPAPSPASLERGGGSGTKEPPAHPLVPPERAGTR